jgi:hypothetical protein
MANRIIGEYIRTSKGIKKGYLMAYKDLNNILVVGWSLYNKNNEDVPFDCYGAKASAYMKCVPVEMLEVPPSIIKNVERFLRRCNKYFYEVPDIKRLPCH